MELESLELSVYLMGTRLIGENFSRLNNSAISNKQSACIE